MSDRETAPDLEFGQEMPDWVEITAPSDGKIVARLEGLLDERFSSVISERDRTSLKIALREVCDNAIEWGNRGDINRRIHVSYCLFPEKIVFKIEDEGDGFDPDQVFDPSEDHLEGLEHREAEKKRFGGYGLVMVRNIMDEVVYNEKGNVVILSKNLEGQPGT